MTEKKWYKFFYAIVWPFIMLFYPMKFIMDAKYRAPFPSLMRWFLTCVNQVRVALVRDV